MIITPKITRIPVGARIVRRLPDEPRGRAVSLSADASMIVFDDVEDLRDYADRLEILANQSCCKPCRL